MRATPNERFSKRVRLKPDEVSAFARAAGDLNPLHHDAAFAERTRFKRLLASGPQMAAQLMGFLATEFAARGTVVGHDMSFRFRQPIHADEEIAFEWQVVGVTTAPRLNGDVVELRGAIRNEAGHIAVSARARVLVGETL